MRAALAILVAVVVKCPAQVSSTVTLSNGVQLTVAVNSSQAIPSNFKIQLEPATGNSFYRIFRDENGLAVFAYAVAVERTADGEHFRVTAKPATGDFANRFPNADAGKPTPTLSEPIESPVLASGDRFVVEIPSDPGVLENISDAVQVRLNRGVSAEQSSRTSAPLRLAGLKVQINNQPASPSGPGAVVGGRYVMFYLPGRGGYFLSTEQVTIPPFVKVGIVDRTHLHFTLDNDVYDCYSDAPILSSGDTGELWVYHDPDYKPAGNWTSSHPESDRGEEFFAAASDSLKWWLP